MAEDNKNLPSINDFANNGENLPSVDDFLTEEVQESLPSVEEFIESNEEQEIIKEDIQTIEDVNGNTFAEVEDIIPPWPELIRMINDVREDIPDIPEIKYYDKELEQLAEQISQIRNEIPEIPEVRYYEKEVEAICEQIDLVREEIKGLPEVKYYDEQVNAIEDRIDLLQTEVVNLPEVKYYDEEIEAICNAIDEVKESIPKFPKWINEVNEVPDFSWIGKTFSVIDDDFIKVNDTIDTLKENIQIDIKKLIEDNEVRHFENKVQFGTEIKDLDEKLGEEKDKIWKELRDSSMKIWEYHKEFKDDDRKLKKQILGEYNKLKQSIKNELKEVSEESIKTDELLLKYFADLREEITNLPEVKYYDEDIRHVKTDIKELFDIVRSIRSEQKEIQNIQEGLLNEPPNKPESVDGQKDPLTPMDQKFATLDDLASHYRLFINRIQQQISTIGGGGAGFIKDLDDVEFDQTTGDGKLLIYDQANSKWVGIASTSLVPKVGAGVTWGIDSVGIHTTKNVGIATTSAKADKSLYVIGDVEITGNISVAGTISYDDVTNVDSIGLITARSGVKVLSGGIESSGISTFNTGIGTVHIGVGSTALLVDGDARVLGILTVGRASITLDGDNNRLLIGDEDIVISNSSITVGSNVTINSSALGINSAPNVIYVAKDGSDSNNGTSIDNAKLTISGAVGIATTGTIIKVLAGNYLENNPIEVPAFVSIVGDDLKTVTVSPNTAADDIFHVRKGCYLANMTFTNHVAPAAAIGFPTTEVATNVGGGKWESPYIQNCTSNTTTGTGLRVDGAQAESLKSIVCDSYTQYNQGGVGIAITNQGFAQLVSVFTICCDEAITCYKGSTCDLTNSNSSFGTYGLVSDGVSDEQFTGIVTTTAAAAQDNVVVALTTSVRPYDGQVVYFGELYESVETITVGSGGTGYTSTPTVTIDAPTGPNGETATAFATLDGDTISEITIISSGSQYATTPTVTISDPQIGSNTATATANMAPIYYTINSSTPVTAGISTLTLEENLINSVGVGTTVYFFQQSKIVASSHTFEYVGSGNDITTATPLRGGVPIQENEVVTTNGGKVVYTSTDQSGNFRIGDDLQINQNTGTISGRAFSRSLFTEITPFILALS